MRILIIFISFFLFIDCIFALGIDSPSTWNIQLQGKINSQRQFMSIDLFDMTIDRGENYRNNERQ